MAALRIKDHWQEQRLFIGRLLAAGLILLLLTAVVVFRLTQLQVAQHQKFADQSSGNQIRVLPIPPIRGLILDRDGRILAENTPSYQLEMTPEQVTDMTATLDRLVRVGIVNAGDIPELRERIRSRRSFDTIVVAERLTDEMLATIAVHRPYLPGLEIRARLGRYYPFGEVAAHALGYVGGISAEDKERLDRALYAGTTHVGKVSVERAAEAALHGRPGHEDVVVNAHGRRMGVLGRERSRPGRDVILSLDMDAQLAAHRALEGRRGAAVAIDPATGEVLAFASTPAFDPNAISAGLSRRAFLALQEDIDRPLFNRALRGQYPPGSTIKPMVALAGLHHGVVRPERRVACPGFFSLPGSRHRYRDWKPQGHGGIDLRASIAESCDVYYYTVARDLGIERLAGSLKDFGLGATTGIDIAGEQGGLVPTPEWKRQAFRQPAQQPWFPGETVIAGIGQGYLLTTPLQLAHATAIIAARGQRFEPTLIRGFRDPVTDEIEYLPPRALPPMPDRDPTHWDAIIEGMYEVMHGPRGTARAVGTGAPFRMAGKSGTAQVFTVGQNERYVASQVPERLRDHALFIAFAPLDEPRIAVAVVVENGESGSRVAAPVARAIMEAYLRTTT